VPVTLHAALDRLTAHSNGTMLYTSVTPSNAEQTYHSSQREISSVWPIFCLKASPWWCRLVPSSFNGSVCTLQ